MDKITLPSITEDQKTTLAKLLENTFNCNTNLAKSWINLVIKREIDNLGDLYQDEAFYLIRKLRR